jgi:hypothetical protein
MMEAAQPLMLADSSAQAEDYRAALDNRSLATAHAEQTTAAASVIRRVLPILLFERPLPTPFTLGNRLWLP